MAITLTDKAASRVRNFLAGRRAAALRFGVKVTGCSGNTYVVEPVDAIGPEDEIFESQGIKIIVDKKNLIFLDGTEIDYTRAGLNEGFRFNNPNEKARCGCGESFTV
jgi:iron-sulfur cluster assembly protein